MIGSAHALGQLVVVAIKVTVRVKVLIADPLLRFFYHTMLGLAVWSYAVFFLGITQLLYPAPLWAIFIGSIIGEIALIWFSFKSTKSARVKRSNESINASSAIEDLVSTQTDCPDQIDVTVDATTKTAEAPLPQPATTDATVNGTPQHKPICWADSLFIILFLVYSTTLFLIALEPPHVWDDISYHLPFARLYADSHALVVGKLLRFPVMNQFAEMLFTAAYMLVDARGAQLVAWNSGILTLIGIYAFLREKFGSYTGAIGALIMCSSKVLSEAYFTAYVETTLTLFVTGFLVALIKVSSDNRRAMLTLAGVCAGCAVATKYTAGVIIGMTLAVWVLPELIRRSLRLRDLAYLLAPAIFVSAPWFIRNFACSGNPVFPFFSNVFGLGGLWNTDDLKFQWLMWKSRCVMPVNLENIFKLPWYLSFECYRFRDSTFSRLAHYALACSLVAIIIKRDRVLIILLVIAEAFLIWWFTTCQNVRYAVPVLPVVALAGGWATHTIWESISRLRFGKAFAAIGLALIVTLGITKGPLRLDREVVLCARKFDEDRFLRKALPTYAAYEFLNGQESGNVYGLWDDRMNFYYTNGTFVGSDFGAGRWGDFLYSTRSEEHMLKFLAKFKIKYLLVSQFPPDYWTLSPAFSRLPKLREMDALRVIFENKNVIVYRVSY